MAIAERLLPPERILSLKQIPPLELLSSKEVSDFRNNLKDLLGLLQEKGYDPLIRKVVRVDKSSFTTRVGEEEFKPDRLEEDEWWNDETIHPERWENNWRLEHGQRAFFIAQQKDNEVRMIDPAKVNSIGFRISWNEEDTEPSPENGNLSIKYDYLDVLVNREGMFEVELGKSESRSYPLFNNICHHDYNDYPYGKDTPIRSFETNCFFEIQQLLKKQA